MPKYDARPVGAVADFVRKTSIIGLCALALWIAPFVQYVCPGWHDPDLVMRRNRKGGFESFQT